MEVVNDGQVKNQRGVRDGSTSAEQADEGGASKALVWLHVHLRGRYWIVALLGILLGGGLGYFGYQLGAPTYRGTGHIQIIKPRPVMTHVDDMTDDLDAFIATQTALLKGGRVADQAVVHPEWRQAKRGGGLEQAEAFSSAVNVAVKDRLLFVSFDDPDPRTAAIGLKVLLAEYRKQYDQLESEFNDGRLGALQGQALDFESKTNEATKRIRVMTETYGSDDLSGLITIRLQAVERLDVLIREMEAKLARPADPAAADPVTGKPVAVPATQPQIKPSAIAATPPSATQPAAAIKGGGSAQPLDLEDLAQDDPVLRELLSERARQERELRAMIEDKYGETHPAVERGQKALARLAKEITLRSQKSTELSRRRHPAATLTPSELEQQIGMLKAQRKEELERSSKLVAANQELRNQRANAERLRAQAEEFRQRISRIKLEFLNTKRIDVFDVGTVPSKPVSDTRPRFAAAGGFLGFLLAAGLVLLPSMLDSRFRSADHTRVTRALAPVVGILPELPENLSDENATAIAAHSVHRTRTLLQGMHRGNVGAQILGITSAQAGTGKTSLALALGVSYATAGSRTLLIDCDLVGGGLSGRVGKMMRRRIGDLLVRDGLITPAQLAEAIILATPSGRRLGEVCVDLGYVEKGDVERAMSRQLGSSVGIMDALAGERIDLCVSETGFPGLQILPLGAAEPEDCASISPAKLERLLREVRGRYDAVIVDTGPVPGSLEAGVVVPHMDGVVVVVSRGERRPVVTRSMEFLEGIGAEVIGVVFNRASAAETEAGSSTSQYRSRSSTPRSGLGLRANPARLSQSELFGPLAQAVAGTSSSVLSGSVDPRSQG